MSERGGDDLPPASLDRYLSGDASPDERAAVDAWVNVDPARREWLERLRVLGARLRDDARSRTTPWSTAAATSRALAAVKARAAAAGTANESASPTLRPEARPGRVGETARRSVVWRVAGIAAVIGILAFGTLTAWRAEWFAPSQQFREFASARGSRTTITLRDGTQLVLGPATHLRVPGDFGTSARAVQLDGEALFTVVHDTRHPFEVRTSRTTVRDVGTTFAVRAYATDPESRVAVGEGEVALPGVALRARDMASIGADGRVTVRRGVDVSAYLGFAQGTLVFKDTPLRDAARDVGRTFDVDVTIADSTLGGAPVTGSFANQPVDEVLRAITYVIGAHYERAGRAVVIRRGVTPVGRPTPGAGASLRMTQAGADR